MICAPYESCLGACNGDPACRSKCTIDHHVPADNAAPVSALSACLASKCESECGLGCGGFAGYLSEPDAAAACQSCFATSNACSDARRCGSSPECDAFWRCYLACATPDCQTTCVADHDAGASLVRSLYKDFSGTCAKPCGYGAYWACAGKVVWPAAESRTYTWTEYVYDWESKMGVPNAQVTVCTSCPCPTATNAVVAQGQTDSDGYVTLNFQQALSITGQGSIPCYQVTAPGYLTAFAYGASPLTKAGWSVRNGLVPRETWGVELFTPAAQQANDESVGATYDPTRAIFVSGGVSDCLGSPAPTGGANVSINTRDPMVLALTATDAGPDAGLTATTGAAGQSYTVIFFDVPVDAGSVTLTTTVPGVGQVSQVAVNAAPNTVVEVPLVTTP